MVRQHGGSPHALVAAVALAPALAIALALALTACAPGAVVTPAPVVAAERAFAADGLAHGVKVSFLEHSAPDAIVLGPDPVNAHASLARMPDLEPGEKRSQLVWWPLWAGVSSSGDLGFTTGPFKLDGVARGHYFTVWKRQPDGAWKWVFDGGVDAVATGQPPPGSPVTYLPLATAGSTSPESAAAEVRAAETDLARRAASDLSTAYLPVLADDARLHTDGQPPAMGRAALAGALSARGRTMAFAQLGGGASRAGDLVWTYGDARWSDGSGDRRGHYVRVWQRRTAGWRVVFDQIVPYRGPPEAPAAGG